MRLEWLEDILAVADSGSFSEAAARRGLTQSAFSRRIQHIEEQVGLELFDRTRKPVQLRAALLDQRDRMENLAEMLRQLVLDLRKGERSGAKRVVIVSQHALTATWTPSFLEELGERDIEAYARLRSANLDECFTQLLSRQADLAIVYRLPGTEHPVRPDFVEVTEMGLDALVPVFAASHMDRLRRHLAASELPYIAYPTDVFLGQALARSLLPELRGRATPEPRAETALTLAALEMADAGVAVAWVPLSLAQRRIAEGRLVDLSHEAGRLDLSVTAVRLRGAAGPVEEAVWSHLLRRGAGS